MDALKPAAKEAKGKMIFVTVDAAQKENAQVLEFFGIKEDETPDYIIFEVITSYLWLIKTRGIANETRALWKASIIFLW